MGSEWEANGKRIRAKLLAVKEKNYLQPFGYSF